MRFISIDLETTGLNPETCQILEIGAVYCNGDYQSPPFHAYIMHELYQGEAFALQMNANILRILSDAKESNIWTPESAVGMFHSWRVEHAGLDPVTYAGKNYGSFDLQFLNRLPNWTFCAKATHRSIDVGSLYLQSDDAVIPSLKECMVRANILGEVPHRAVDDAIMVAELIRRRWA